MLLPKIKRWIAGLRYPWLLLLGVTLLVVNVLVPDPIPLVDEALLAIAAGLLAGLKKKRRKDEGVAEPEGQLPGDGGS